MMLFGRPRERAPWTPRGVHTPTAYQFEKTECGAACLKMILGYWGRWAALEEIRNACSVSRNGSKAINILNAARSYGLVGNGVRRELHELNDIALPCIAHWGFRHFVVLEALLSHGVRINDPEKGRRVVPMRELDRSYTGVVLTFSPGETFFKAGTEPTFLSLLAGQLRSARRELTLLALISLTLIVPALLIPSFTKIFIDNYLIRNEQDWLRPALFAFGLTILVQSLLIGLQQRVMRRLQVKLAAASARTFVWRLLNLPIDFFLQRSTGDLVNRVDANQRVAQLVAGDAVGTLVGLVTVVLYALIMLTYDVSLAAVAVGLGAINGVVTFHVWERLERLSRRSLQNQSRLSALSIAGLADIEGLKASANEAGFLRIWLAQQCDFVSLQQHLGIGTITLSAAATLLSGLSSVAVLWVGATRVMHGALTIGELIAFQALLSGFNAPIKDFVNAGSRIRQGTADLGRLHDVLDSTPDELGPEQMEHRAAVQPAASVARLPGGRAKLHGLLEFSAVTFGFSRLDPPLIVNFELSVRPGSRVAIVGQTGSGKSTVARLAAGLYRPWSGTICYDRQPLGSLDRDVFAHSVAFVDQDTCLFSGTIRDNIALWDESLEFATVTAAARDACIHECASMRAHGYMGNIAEAGRDLSGGERQRLEIARALAREPSVLILDEATAALDTVVEQAIDGNLRRRGCTCLIVAHRLSTVRDCDEIIVMKRGRIAQRGTHESLLREGGEYARLYHAQ